MRVLAFAVFLLTSTASHAQTLSLDIVSNALNATAQCTAVYLKLEPLLMLATMGAQSQRDQITMMAAVKENESMIRQYRSAAKRIMAKHAAQHGLDSDKLNITHEAAINLMVEAIPAKTDDDLDALFTAAGRCHETLAPMMATMQVGPE
jgi:hypothetical protein